MDADRLVAPLGLRCAWLHSGDPPDRHRDLTLSEDFLRFLEREVLPRLGAIDVVVGLSLSGLAAAHASFRRPHLFPRAVCQSPSAWFDDERLVRELRDAGGADAPAWISVGRGEVEHGVSHPPTGLFQGTSQLDACGRLAEAWGPTARFAPFDGGHDFACWSAELVEALSWVLRDSSGVEGR